MPQRGGLCGWIIGAVCLLIGPGSATPALADTGLECLARTIYFEAKSDGVESMEAVGAVVMNRVRHPEFPDDVCAVIEDGGETPPCQFSYWCDGKSDSPEDPEAWATALDVASRVLEGGTAETVGNALFFHSKAIDPPYRETRELVAEVGSHLFYR